MRLINDRKRRLVKWLTIFLFPSSLRKRARKALLGRLEHSKTIALELAYKNWLLENFLDIKSIKALPEMRIRQIACLDILLATTSVLEKHDIPYYLDYGTLLGAIRHGGFIPWDDDVDITIMHADLPKVTSAMQDLPKHMQFSVAGKNRGFFKVSCNNGTSDAFVDIFLAYTVNAMTAEDCQNLRARYEKFKYSKMHHKTALLDAQTEILGSYHIPNPQGISCEVHVLDTSIGAFFAQPRTPVTIPKTDIFPLQRVNFEGHYFYAPRNYDLLLKKTYGDYMKLPKILLSRLHDKNLINEIARKLM